MNKISRSLSNLSTLFYLPLLPNNDGFKGDLSTMEAPAQKGTASSMKEDQCTASSGGECCTPSESFISQTRSDSVQVFDDDQVLKGPSVTEQYLVSFESISQIGSGLG